MTKKVFMSGSIIIKTTAEKLFDYIANGDNDPNWRKEVDKMEIQGAIQQGTLMVEYSSFYKFFHTKTPTIIKVLTPPNQVVLETPDTHTTWLQSIRTIEKTEHQTVKFTYQLGFSLDAMKQILPFIPPAKLVKIWYKPRIDKYLKNLKQIVEEI